MTTHLRAHRQGCEPGALRMNERAAEHARLARIAAEKRRLSDEYGGHGYECEAVLAEEALERFENGSHSEEGAA